MPSKEAGAFDSATVLEAFRAMRESIDDCIVKNKIDTHCSEFIPRTDELAIAVFCNAFEVLGCLIRSAAPGTKLDPIKKIPRHEKLINYMYKTLENKAGLIETKGEEIVRTPVPCPSSQIEDMLEDLFDDMPEQEWELGLVQRTGGSFANCLSGKEDPLQLLFGSDEGRTLMANFYAKSRCSAQFSSNGQLSSTTLAASGQRKPDLYEFWKSAQVPGGQLLRLSQCWPVLAYQWYTP